GGSAARTAEPVANSTNTTSFKAPDNRMPSSCRWNEPMYVVLTTYRIPAWKDCQRPTIGEACQKTGRPHPAQCDSEGARWPTKQKLPDASRLPARERQSYAKRRRNPGASGRRIRRVRHCCALRSQNSRAKAMAVL